MIDDTNYRTQYTWHIYFAKTCILGPEDDEKSEHDLAKQTLSPKNYSKWSLIHLP
jgi:hypothetical protein